MTAMRSATRRTFLCASLAAMFGAAPGLAGLPSGQALAQGEAPRSFSTDDLIGSGHHFFGTISRGLAQTVEEATRRFGQPNGYILGQELSGAFVGGLRYGEGILYTRNAGDIKVFWQGPSIGFDAGADGDRTMMLVYKLPATPAIYSRFVGVDGSAYFVGGVGVNYQRRENVTLAPMRAGVGFRLGASIGYLAYSRRRRLNPF